MHGTRRVDFSWALIYLEIFYLNIISVNIFALSWTDTCIYSPYSLQEKNRDEGQSEFYIQ